MRRGAVEQVVKGIGITTIMVVTLALLTACGGDNNTTFVLGSGSPSSTGSAKASASAAASASASAGSSSLPNTAATPIANGLRVIIDSPDGSSSISSPVEVLGTASVADGAVLVVVKDASGNELGRATTTASASKPDFGHYDVSVTFSGATSGGKGEIRVMDAATQKNYYFITIRFA